MNHILAPHSRHGDETLGVRLEKILGVGKRVKWRSVYCYAGAYRGLMLRCGCLVWFANVSILGTSPYLWRCTYDRADHVRCSKIPPLAPRSHPRPRPFGIARCSRKDPPEIAEYQHVGWAGVRVGVVCLPQESFLGVHDPCGLLF